MMKFNTYLHFNGQCEAAFKFYADALGGKIQSMMRFGESPMAKNISPDWHGKIIHATMIHASGDLMGSDVPPDHFSKPQGFSVTINLSDPVEAERIYKTLSQGGNIQMPLQETFWAVRFGQFTDKFGIPWMINCGKPQ